MTQGSLKKTCSCKDGAGRRLGPRCPDLRRPGGSWHPTHGWWAFQLELPTTPGGRRRQLRRSGFDTREAAAAERDHAKNLLKLAGRDHAVAVQIGDVLLQTKTGQPLPDRDHLARRINA